MYRHIYQEVGKIVKANPRLHIPSSFYDWMHQSYAQVMVIGIGRLVDYEKRRQPQRVISLVRLMREIREHPSVLTRRRFVELYRKNPNPVVMSWGHRDFERFASPTGKRVDCRIIYNHERRLTKAAKRIQRFRHKHIAHRDERSLKKLPTHEDIEKCIDVLSELLKFYMRLLEARSLTQVLPVWQYDWKQVFRVAWIEKDLDRKSGPLNSTS